ncbi:serine protease, partial [Haliscomenobacter sp.]|uniref:S1C family serine protease n=1 Tax=Haliscomenobacter sp. TaxID=2717303 RepID=UPI0033650880
MKRISTVILIVITLVINSISPANAAVTWSQTSTLDTTFDGSVYNPQYDLEYTTVAIFDNNSDKINFYLEFSKIPTVNMFNTGNAAFGVILLDYDFNNQADFALYTQDVTLTTDLTGVDGLANVWTGGVNVYSPCAVSVFTNIAEGKKWIGFSTSRSCIGLPKSFGLLGLAQNNSKNSGKDFDFAPTNYFRVNLPTTATGGSTTTTNPDVGATFILPTTKANESKAASTYSDSPQDLSKLSEDLLPSVVTVQCDGGSGTGWSADVAMSTDLQSAGYKSLVVTNHHVIQNCLTSKLVTLVLNSKVSLPGTIVSWSKNDDIAGIAVKSSIPALQWIGSNPKQGWWVGVLGSPLGVSGILTTGIISSTNSIGSRFTFTAAINPGNSGGPVFDSTGRVLGLATSKNLISTDSLAEGFGNAQGTPLLCSIIVSCTIEKSPWNGTPKYPSSSSVIDKAAAEAAAKIAQEKAVADAKAAAEGAAKIAQDKAVADAKAAAEGAAKIAQDKAVADAKAAAEGAAKIAQ